MGCKLINHHVHSLKSVCMPFTTGKHYMAPIYTRRLCSASLFPCSVEEAYDAIGLPHPGEVRSMDRS